MQRRAYWLFGLHGSVRKVRTPIRGPILIGRGSYNHVVLPDPRISRQHGRIALEDEGCVVYDLGSSNGTFVNGIRVTRHILKLHDEVSFGSVTFRIAAGSQEIGGDGDFADLEEPTLRDFGSVSKMLAVMPGGAGESSAQLPVVDLGQLEDAYDKLGTLYTFMQAISQTIVTKELLALIAAKTREVYRAANSVGIYVLARDANEGESFKLVFSLADDASEPQVQVLPAALAASIVQSQKPLLSQPAAGRMSGGTSMHAPMTHRMETVGIIHVAADPRTGGFSRPDLDLLAGMAAPAGMMLQNAKHHDELLQRDRLNYDLELAAQIQKSFLPREVVSVEGVELFAEYRAAYSVGGDFYDVFWVGPDRLGVFIGDISGKGVAGALLMARISSEMRVVALAQIEPVAVLTTLNKALISRNQPELFFTAIYMTIDVRSGDVVLANAGHPSPYCSREDGTLQEITEGAGGPVGIVDDPMFESTYLRLGHADSLILYTDGVIEATGENGTLYGSDRLERVLAGAGTRPAEIAEGILAAVAEHAGNVPANDDITLFIVQRTIGRPASMQPRRRSGMLNRAEP